MKVNIARFGRMCSRASATGAAAALGLSMSLACGGGGGPSGPEVGAVDVYTRNDTQATVLAGPVVLYFLKPGEEVLSLHTEAPVPDVTVRVYDYLVPDNRPVPFLEFVLTVPRLPAAGTCAERVGVTRTTATPDGRCGVSVTSVKTLP